MAALAQSTVALNQSMAMVNQSTAALNQSMATMSQTQSAFLAQLAETDKELANLKRQSDERFARVEKNIDAILHVLAEHSRLLERLPDALRDKIGFKPQSWPSRDTCVALDFFPQLR